MNIESTKVLGIYWSNKRPQKSSEKSSLLKEQKEISVEMRIYISKLSLSAYNSGQNRKVSLRPTDDTKRLRSLDLEFEEFAGDCSRHANNSLKIDPLPEDFGQKLGGAGTEILRISQAHDNAPITLMGYTFRGLSALRELTIEATE